MEWLKQKRLDSKGRTDDLVVYDNISDNIQPFEWVCGIQSRDFRWNGDWRYFRTDSDEMSSRWQPFRFCDYMHWSVNAVILITLSSTVVPKVAVLTTCGVASDENVVKIPTLHFRFNVLHPHNLVITIVPNT